MSPITEPQPIRNVLKNQHRVKLPAHPWQELALQIIERLNVPSNKKSAVFKACKQYSRPIIEKSFNDTLELTNAGERWKYFFKLLSNFRKPPSAS